MRWGPHGLIVCATLATVSAPASAGDNDLVLARLSTVASGELIPDTPDFRTLASELGVVFAPRLTSPARTLGFGGFQFSTDIGFTRISSDRPHWRALRSSRDPANPNIRHGERSMTTVGIFAHKGIWLPLPSFEFGVGAVYLLDSRMWAAQGFVKAALVEGYTDQPIPSVALRLAGSRLMGEPQLDLTVVSTDLSVSKEIGVMETFKVSPFGGYNLLFIVPRSDVIDKTPHIDSLVDPTDAQMNFVFPDQNVIIRHRAFLGAKLTYDIFTFTLQGVLAFAGGSSDSVAGVDVPCMPGPATTLACNATDDASTQLTFQTAIGLEF